MLRKKIGVLISGGGSNLQSLIDAEDLAGDISLVVSNRKDAYGLTRAKNAGIEAVFLEQGEDYDSRLLRLVLDREIDLLVLAGYLRVLDPELVEEYRGRIINIHPSLIPSFCGKGYYGMNVHREVYRRGVKLSGCTVHFVDEGTDTGPIILQKAVAIDFSDGPDDIQKKVLVKEHEALVEAVRLYCLDRLTIKDARVKIEG